MDVPVYFSLLGEGGVGFREEGAREVWGNDGADEGVEGEGGEDLVGVGG